MTPLPRHSHREAVLVLVAMLAFLLALASLLVWLVPTREWKLASAEMPYTVVPQSRPVLVDPVTP